MFRKQKATVRGRTGQIVVPDKALLKGYLEELGAGVLMEGDNRGPQAFFFFPDVHREVTDDQMVASIPLPEEPPFADYMGEDLELGLILIFTFLKARERAGNVGLYMEALPVPVLKPRLDIGLVFVNEWNASHLLPRAVLSENGQLWYTHLILWKDGLSPATFAAACDSFVGATIASLRGIYQNDPSPFLQGYLSGDQGGEP